MIQQPDYSSEDEEDSSGKINSVEALKMKAAAGYDLSEEELDAITNDALGSAYLEGAEYIR